MHTRVHSGKRVNFVRYILLSLEKKRKVPNFSILYTRQLGPGNRDVASDLGLIGSVTLNGQYSSVCI